MRARDAGGKWMSSKRPPPKAKANLKAKGNGHTKDVSQPEPAAKPRFQITPEQIAQARSMPRLGAERPPPGFSPFAPAGMPPGVLPPGRKQKMAMDEFPGTQWAGGIIDNQSAMLAAYDYGVSFMGYPLLSVLAQIPEYRNISECIATEMTRRWIRFRSRADADLEQGKEGESDENDAENPSNEGKGPEDGSMDKPVDKPAQDLALTPEEEAELELLAALVDGEGGEQKPSEEKPSEKDDDADADEDAPEGEGEGEAGMPGGEQIEEEVTAIAASEKAEKIRQIEDAFERLGVRDLFTQTALNDGLMGRAHIFIDFGEPAGTPETKEELLTSIGDGRGPMSEAKVTPDHPIKRLVAVEPTWAYPANYNASNPLAENWYNPESWYVQQQEIDSSRFLTFVGRPVPDMLKPAFAFGGLSLTQMAKPTVENWLQTRRSVGMIISAFSVFVLATNLNQELQAGGNFLHRRAQAFNSMRDNQGLMIIDKDNEDFQNIAAPLSTLDVLQAQSQEHMSAVSRIPIVKLLGIQPAGLNADSDGIIRTFYDSISAHQERFFRPHLMKIFWMVQRSLWGEIDDDLTFDFEPLWEMDELQKAQKRKADADTAKVLIDAGVIDPEEDRQRLADDPDTPYNNIDPAQVPEPPEPEMPPGGPGGFGLPSPPGFGGPPKPPGGAAKPPPAKEP